MNAIIYNALSLFVASPTGRGRRGNDAMRAFARRVVRQLGVEWREEDIGFEKISGSFVGGFARDHWITKLGGYDLTINALLDRDFLSTSLVLAHEGGHLAMDIAPLNSELWSRMLALWYFADLRAGDHNSAGKWRYYDHQSKLQWSPDLPRPYSTFLSQMDAQLKAAQKDQLLDYILTFQEYQELLTEEWVRRNFNQYGGIHARNFSSRGLYIKALAKDPRLENGKLIFEVLKSTVRDTRLESTKRPNQAWLVFLEKAEWDLLVTTAGGIGVIRKGLTPLQDSYYRGLLKDIGHYWSVEL